MQEPICFDPADGTLYALAGLLLLVVKAAAPAVRAYLAKRRK